MRLPTEKELQQFDGWNQPRPSHEEHDIRDTAEHPLSEQLKSGNARNWRMEGNLLHCDTDFGPMMQVMPTHLILTGTDEKGLPTFKTL